MSNLEALIEEFACPGCQRGSDTKCGSYSPLKVKTWSRCEKAARGFSEMKPSIGLWIPQYLGLPKGFCRVGQITDQLLQFVPKEDEIGMDKFNVPVWKMKHKGHTLVRGLSPRVNSPFLLVVEGQDRFDEINCIEITAKDLEEMD